MVYVRHSPKQMLLLLLVDEFHFFVFYVRAVVFCFELFVSKIMNDIGNNISATTWQIIKLSTTNKSQNKLSGKQIILNLFSLYSIFSIARFWTVILMPSKMVLIGVCKAGEEEEVRGEREYQMKIHVIHVCAKNYNVFVLDMYFYVDGDHVVVLTNF